MISTTRNLLLMFALSLAATAQQTPLPDAPTPQPNAGEPRMEIPAELKRPNPAPPPAEEPAEPAAAEPQAAPVAPPKMPPIRTTTRSTKRGDENSREELFTLRKSVTFVSVPVTVKDSEGRLVTGLLPNEFSVYEEGIKQNVTFFTSDPFPISAAVVISTGMSSQQLKKVQETMPALTGAFSQYDEVALFTYGSTVRRVSDFAAAGSEAVVEAIRRVQRGRGRNAGAPVVQGPMASGPSVNNRPAMPGGPMIPTVEQESHVLNDAMLAAATELARRDTAPHWQKQEIRPRKIIFVISNGREDGSEASYGDVLKVLLTNDITVYAVGVGEAAIPGVRDLGKFRIPGFGQNNALPKYASATGGQVFAEFGVEAIETAYGEITSVARNQYTLGYQSRTSASGTYRTIEVRVRRPGLKVYARDGYYPAPPLRPGQTGQ